MMKSAFLLSTMLLAATVCCACTGIQQKKVPRARAIAFAPDSMVYANLGKTISDVVFSPRRVTCYRLKGVETIPEGAIEVLPHYIREEALATLTPEDIGILQFLLLSDNESYQKDSVRVRSPYVPEIEFEFVKRKSVVHVILSLSDMTWTVVYDDKQHFHYNYANKQAIARFCNIILYKNLNTEK